MEAQPPTFFYGSTFLFELDSVNNVKVHYGPGYIVRNDTTYRVLRDHLSSVRMVINSETGEVVQRIDYDEYGNITYLQNQDEFTDIGFAGGLYDMDTGLIRFGARDYDPEVGRWTTKDPILFDGGTSNLYEYALNDPINMTDKKGLQATSNRSNSLDPSTLFQQPFGAHYPGPFNPTTHNGDPDYSTPPVNIAGYPAIGHDRRYGNLEIKGAKGLFFDGRAIGADWQFVKEELEVAALSYSSGDYETSLKASFYAGVIGVAALPKTIIIGAIDKNGYFINSWYHRSNIDVTNQPSCN